MKNMIKKSLFSVAGIFLLAQNNFANAMNFGEGNVSSGVKGSENTADTVIQNLITTAATFLAIVAVIFAIYGWFSILTAGGADDKVKKWKTILVQALLWLLVIWIANSVVQWVITKLLTPSA